MADRLLVLNLRQKNDDKNDGESPGGEKPKYGELPPDNAVVSYHCEHVKSLYRDPQDGKESRDYGHHEQTIEKLEMVTALLEEGGDETNDAVQ